MSRQFFSCGPILPTFWRFSPCPCLAAGAVNRSAYLFLRAGKRAISALGGLCQSLGGLLLFAPGQMVIFFKDGPFSWHGIVAMYLPFIAFFAWIAIMSWVMIKIAHDENS